VRCDAPYVGVRPFTLAQTFGASSKYRQYVTGDAWFYRYNGSSWVYQQTVGADVDLGPQTGAYRTGTFPGANIVVAKGGYYHVKLWLTWFIQYPDGRWVQTAQGAYNFDQAGDYGFGASAGPGGFCKT
jgi:hypothetical protein